MILDDLLLYVSAQSGCGASGVDLFAGLMPDVDGVVADLCTQISEYAAEASEVRFGLSGVYREKPRIQFQTRSDRRDYQSGRTRIENQYRAIGAMNLPALVNGVMYHNITILQSPFWLKHDEKRRDHFAFNVRFYKDPD